MSKRGNVPGAKAESPSSSGTLTRGLTSVRSGLLQRQCSCGGGTAGCQTCAERKRKLLRAARPEARSGPATAPPIVDEVLSSPGQPLDSSTRSHMEDRFGHDFSGVRVHADGKAAASARGVDALAYTVGNHIVFDQGEYAPGTSRGQRLLAHELAHTVQQQGTAPTGPLTYDSPGESALEREADAAATAAMATPATDAATVPPLAQHPATALISRQARSWEPIKPSRQFDTQDKIGGNWEHQVTGISPAVPANGRSVPSTVAVRLEPLHLLPAKGPVVEQYQKKIDAQALEATISFEGKSPKAGLKQARDITSDLQDSWLGRVGWDSTNKDKNWEQAGGSAQFPILKGGGKCQMDHIVELQLGGSNIPQNIIPLDASDNGASGRSVWLQLQDLARTIRDSDLFPDNEKPTEIILHFTQVAQSPQIKPLQPDPKNGDSCLQVAANATALQLTASPGGFTLYEVSAAGDSTVFDAKPAPDATILEKSTARNEAARQLIPGLLLTTLARPARGLDTMHASLDERPKTRLPITLQPLKGTKHDIVFNVKPAPAADPNASTGSASAKDARQLELTTASKTLPELTFTYPYLSEGRLRPELSPDLKLTAKGTLTPSLPLLKKVPIDVFADFDKEEFRGSVSFPLKKLNPPFKFMRFTKSELGVELSPQFQASGVAEFEMGPEGKPWMEGSVTATADATRGFVATGKLSANLPGVAKAEGTVEYTHDGWTGQVDIASNQIALPYVKEGSLQVLIASKEGATSLQASGGVTFQPPGFEPITFKAQRKGDRWLYEGTGAFKVPGIDKPVTFELTHDGSKLTGTAKAAVSRGGLSGDFKVHYDSEKGVSGEGALAFKNQKLDASIHKARLSETGKLSGKGTLKYAFASNMEATASVELTEDQHLKLDGALHIPKPVTLFSKHPNSYSLFSKQVDIPIVGVSAGSISIGLIARISGGLEAHYSIGPATLKDVSATTGATFNLNDLSKVSFNGVNLKGTLDIPASAGLSLSVRGAVGLSAGVASVTGGITATGSADLVGGLSTTANLQYTQNRFVLDVTPSIKAGLVLSLGLSADVTAEALWFEKTWSWRLADYAWNTGLVFGLTAPIHYDSNATFKLPSPSEIQWLVPDINVKQLVSSLIDRVKR